MNASIKIAKFDFFGEEWAGNCGACFKDMYAPTKGEYNVAYRLHTHSEECLGGW